MAVPTAVSCAFSFPLMLPPPRETPLQLSRPGCEPLRLPLTPPRVIVVNSGVSPQGSRSVARGGVREPGKGTRKRRFGVKVRHDFQPFDTRVAPQGSR